MNVIVTCKSCIKLFHPGCDQA